jgi:hypothetical protein
VAIALVPSHPAIAQDKPEHEDVAGDLRFDHLYRFRRDGEAVFVLEGDAQARLGLPRRAETAARSAPPSRLQVIDVKADAVVLFVPNGPDRASDIPWRALYAEGFVRLEAFEVPCGPDGKPRPGAKPPVPSVIEADRLWLDLVRERGWASKARLRGGAPAHGTRLPSQFILRADELRMATLDTVEAKDASLSVCEFGLPHEAVEAKTIRLVLPTPPGRPFPAAAVALGDMGGAVVARRPPGRLWLARDIRSDRKDSVREGSDALYHRGLETKRLEVEDAQVRLRPPYVGEEGFAIPVLPWFAWQSNWPFPDVRVGHSSAFGWFGELGARIPLVEKDLVHEDGWKHERRGLELDTKVGVEGYEKRGAAGDFALHWDFSGEGEKRLADGALRFYGIVDQGDVDRNGTPVPDDRNRYWLSFLHQEFVPQVGNLQIDSEVQKQSDRNFLLEYQRQVARTEKEQETYIYARESWDEIGARLIGKWRLNDFQTQTEELPRARVDVITSPIFTTEYLGGLYATLGLEGAHLRQRFDVDTPFTDEPRIGRGDFDGRLDYKIALGPLYARAWAEGEYTAWSDNAKDDRAIDRYVGAWGGNLSTWIHRPFELPFELGTIRHVLIPSIGYEDRPLVTRTPDQLLQFDQIDAIFPTEFFYARVRNRIQLASSAIQEGGGATDLLDVSVEGRYFPHLRDNPPTFESKSEITVDGKIWALTYGYARVRMEIDPNEYARHKLPLFESSVNATPVKWLTLSASYNDVRDVARAVGWAAEWKITPCWSARVEELYDLDQRKFLRHKGVVRRIFHELALEFTGSYDPLLNDLAFTVSVTPAFDTEERPDPFKFGRLAGLEGN